MPTRKAVRLLNIQSVGADRSEQITQIQIRRSDHSGLNHVDFSKRIPIVCKIHVDVNIESVLFYPQTYEEVCGGGGGGGGRRGASPPPPII